MKREFRFFSALTFGLVVAGAAMAQAPPPTVVLGTDYFRTLPGTYDTIYPYGRVDFQGVPIGPGSADTIIERTSDIVINGPDGGPLMMTALSLRGEVSPTTNDPIFIYATLNPNVQSTGWMWINGSLGGGTFNATLDVFFDICLAPGAHGVGCAGGAMPLFTGQLDLTDTNSPWGPTMPPNPVAIVMGLVRDQAADVHTNLESWQTDFWPVADSCAPTACHPVSTSTPEPSTWLMLLAGFGGLGYAGYRARRAKALAAV